MRLIAVVMGTPSDEARNDDANKLLNWGWRFFTSKTLFTAGQTITTPRVWLGADKTVAMGVSKNVTLIIPKGSYKNLKASLTMQTPLKAPIAKGNTYGKLTISLKGKVLETVPVVALADDPEGGFWTRISDHVRMWVNSL